MEDKTLFALTSFLLVKHNEKEFNNINSGLSDTSTSDSEDEENISLNTELEIIYLVLMVAETRGETVYIDKIEDYVERVIPGYSRTISKEHFR